MKNLKLAFVVVLLLGLALLVAACGGASPEIGPTDDVGQVQPTATPKPTDTPVPTPTPSPAPEEEELDASTIAKPEDLDSFRSNVEMSWQGTLTNGQESTGTLTMLIEFVREPLAEHVSLSGNFPGAEDLQQLGAEGSTMDIYMVEGTTYMNLFGSWMQVPMDESQFNAEDMAFGTSEEVLSELKGAKYVGRETINGIETKHYTFDESAIDQSQMTDGGEITDAQGDVYVAVEGNYLVRFEMTFTGTNFEVPSGTSEGLQEGTFNLLMDLSSINEPITIAVPDEARESGGVPDDIPVPEGAEEVSSLMGMITFKSAQTTAQVADFYKAEMPNNGWTQTTAEEISDMFTLEYTKDNRTASVLITADSDTGKTSVLITVSEK